MKHLDAEKHNYAAVIAPAWPYIAGVVEACAVDEHIHGEEPGGDEKIIEAFDIVRKAIAAFTMPHLCELKVVQHRDRSWLRVKPFMIHMMGLDPERAFNGNSFWNRCDNVFALEMDTDAKVFLDAAKVMQFTVITPDRTDMTVEKIESYSWRAIRLVEATAQLSMCPMKWKPIGDFRNIPDRGPEI